MKDLAFGGAYWVVDFEATSLMTGSKEFVVIIKSLISTILMTTTQANLKRSCFVGIALEKMNHDEVCQTNSMQVL
jgi:hypothetical protein